MNHVAIDLGGRESQMCVRASDGTVLEERRYPTRALEGLLAVMPPSRVVVETCAEAFRIADAALEHGHEVRVVPAALVRSLGVGARRTKTDRRDAQTLSEVSCRIDLPSVHVPSRESRRRKSLCGMREALVSARTQLANSIRGWLRGQGRKLRRGAVESLVTRMRAAFAEGELPEFVERQLQAFAALRAAVREADQELERLAHADPLCQRLRTVPGVGPVTAVRFVAALDDVARFAHAHQVESYLGLVPGERSSGDQQHRLSITKAGPSALRRTLVQAAWVARMTRTPQPMVAWAVEIEKRRGKQVAVIALARKLVGILFALWRDGTTYDPRRGARLPPASPESMLATVASPAP